MSSRDILSQEEVDALLKVHDDDDQDSGLELTAEDKDVIGEIGNISMGTAATALFTLLNKKVEITAPTVTMTTLQKLLNEYDRPCILVEVEYIAGVEGRNILIIKQQDAAVIADLMMGGDGENPPKELNEIQLSAVGESMNQMMGSAATSLADIINRPVNISPPSTELLTLNTDALKARDFDPSSNVVKISFQMKIDGLVDSHIMQLAPISFVKEMVASLMGDAETASTAVAYDEEPVVEPTPQPQMQQQQMAPQQQMQQQPMQQQQMQQQQMQQQQQPMQQQQMQPQQQPYMGGMQGMQQQQPQPQQMGQQSSNLMHDPVSVDRAQFPEFESLGVGAGVPSNISLIEDVPLQVAVQLGKTKMPIKDILELGAGSIIELDKLAGEPVDLLVNGKLVAKGEVVVIDENFGFRVKDIVSPLERLKQI